MTDTPPITLVIETTPRGLAIAANTAGVRVVLLTPPPDTAAERRAATYRGEAPIHYMTTRGFREASAEIRDAHCDVAIAEWIEDVAATIARRDAAYGADVAP